MVRTASAAGAASLAGVSGVGAASQERTDLDGGDGTELRRFLTEPAASRPAPLWDGVVVDRTDRARVEIVVGALAPIRGSGERGDDGLPVTIGPPETSIAREPPVAFAPRAVAVSPGTTVVWRWPAYDDPVPVMAHDVVSVAEGGFDSDLRDPGDGDFEHAFAELGTHRYYCTAHGAPFPVFRQGGGPDEEVSNGYGMRGAVIVTVDGLGVGLSGGVGIPR